MVIDASVAFKWIAPEENSSEAFDLIGREPLVAPVLMLIEVGNALWKKAVREQIDPGTNFAPDLDSLGSLVMLQDEAPFVPRALEMARFLSHPIYDCIYLALAEAAGTELITADRRFLAAVKPSEWNGLVEILA